jgi:thiol-disulfide isomerase/thioredoxin
LALVASASEQGVGTGAEAVPPATENANGNSAGEQLEYDERNLISEIQLQFARGEFDAGQEQLKAAIEQHPDSSRLKSLHQFAYIRLRSAGRMEEAFEHLKAYVDYEMTATAKNGRYWESFPLRLGMLVAFANQLGGPERATGLLDEFVKRAEELEGANGQLLQGVDAQRAIHLARMGRTDEARAIVDAQVTAADEALAQAGDDANSILRKATALSNRLALESATQGGDPNAARTELLDFLLAQSQEHPDARAVVGRFQSEHLKAARTLARTDPDAAEALLNRIENLSRDYSAEDSENGSQAAGSRLLIANDSPIAAIRAQIEKSRKMLALVGSPAAYPENVDGWVNGDAQTPESLKGKVVLLDFFAVWCGPCIATFPHLREWHDEFADQGLQIIGVSNYYQYGWDEAAGRASRQADLEPEAERAAMEQFVKHHELRHTIAYVTGRELQDFYVVSGIPHAVVIDRQGKVRLFRIGSGEQNAADLKRAIEDCLAESAPSQ